MNDMHEYILRDNEIAINQPDGTVVIMNLEAYKALRDEKPNTEYQKTITNLQNLLAKRDDQLKNAKTIQAGYEFQMEKLQKQLQEANARVERYKEANDSAVRANNARVDKINELKAEVDVLRTELNTVLEERDGFFNENEKLTITVREKNVEIQKLQKELNRHSRMVLWGAGTKFPKKTPDFVYVTSEGEIFLSGLAIERAYNLPKGSVSAYFADKQKRLYPRNPDGTCRVDEVKGDIFRLGVVRRFTTHLFLHGNWNCPVFEAIDEGITTAKKYTDEL